MRDVRHLAPILYAIVIVALLLAGVSGTALVVVLVVGAMLIGAVYAGPGRRYRGQG